MRRSTDRILTTHVGALPAPIDVWAQPEVTDERLGEAVTEVCDMQTSAGVDFINEGELTKGGHWTSTCRPTRRLRARRRARRLGKLLMSSNDWVDFLEFYLAVLKNGTLFEQSGRHRTCRRAPRTASPSSTTGCAPGRSLRARPRSSARSR